MRRRKDRHQLLARAALVPALCSLFLSCGGKTRGTTDDSERNTQENAPEASEPEEGPCELRPLVTARAGSEARDCTEEADRSACFLAAQARGESSFWIGEQTAGTDSLVQRAIAVSASGEAEVYHWDSDPSGGAGYAPTASVAPCPMLGSDPLCESPGQALVLCAYGVPIATPAR